MTSVSGRHLPFKTALEAQLELDPSERDITAVIPLLHPDVVFQSPAVYKPYEGRDACVMILAAVAQVLEDFHYVDILDAGNSVGLVFRAAVGERQIQGWDYLQFDDDGLITSFTVMIRPLSGLNAIVARMGELLGVAPST